MFFKKIKVQLYRQKGNIINLNLRSLRLLCHLTSRRFNQLASEPAQRGAKDCGASFFAIPSRPVPSRPDSYRERSGVIGSYRELSGRVRFASFGSRRNSLDGEQKPIAPARWPTKPTVCPGRRNCRGAEKLINDLDVSLIDV
jgi:hypothetical protein